MRRPVSLGLSVLLVGALAVPAAAQTAAAGPRVIASGGPSAIADVILAEAGTITGGETLRVAGPDRFATAAAIASGFNQRGTVVIASGRTFADALPGVPLARGADAPLLLVEQNGIPQPTSAALAQLEPTEILVLGGPLAISDAVVNALSSFTAGPVTRLSGADRYATAAAISERFDTEISRVYLAVGTNFPDALAGGMAGGLLGVPVLLTQRDAVPTVTLAAIARLNPDEIVLLGGPDAINPSVATQLSAMGIRTTRIGGADRFETAALVARSLFPDGADRYYLASGLDFPDALAIGVVAAGGGNGTFARSAHGEDGVGPLLLTNNPLPGPTRDALQGISGLGNEAPTAADGAAATAADTAVDISLEGTDADGDTLTYTLVTDPTRGTVTITGDTATYTPAGGGFTDTFAYAVSDGAATSAAATVTIEVERPFGAPVVDLGGPDAPDLAATFTEDGGPVALTGTDNSVTDADADAITTMTVTLTGDVDGSDEVLTVDTAGTTASTATSDGVITISSPDADGISAEDMSAVLASIEYENLNQNPTSGDRTVAVAATDVTGGTSADAIATVTVVPVDDPAVAVNDTDTVSEDGGATTIDVQANDTDIDGGISTIDAITQPDFGTVVITNEGADLTYEPDADYCNAVERVAGTDDFTYTLAPGGSTANVAISVSCGDDAPVAVDDTETVTEDDPATTIDVLDNDTDVDGGPISIDAVTQPDNGTVVITNGGDDLTYEPNADVCTVDLRRTFIGGTDDFTYTLTPGDSTATVAMHITCVDDAPVAVNDTKTVTEDDPATTIDVLDNDTDVDGGPISIDAVTQPPNGAVVITNGGDDLTYQPNANFCTGNTRIVSPVNTFTYTLTPGGDTATVSLTVTCVDDAPVAVQDNDTVLTEDDPATTIDVLDNDTDIDGGPISIGAVTQPNNGTVVITNDGDDLTYEPGADLCTVDTPSTIIDGPDTFTYTLTPGTSTATVTVRVTCVDDAPVAVNDDVSLTEDDPATTIDVLDNDTDVDGGPISIDTVTQPTGGTVVITNGGDDLTYEPDPDFCTQSTGRIVPASPNFTYTLAPGGSTATVTISVECVNEIPVAVDDTPTVTEDDAATTIDVLTNDTDSDGGLKTIESVTQPPGGVVVITNAGDDLTYTPGADFCTAAGTDDFTYTLNGGNSATVAVTVTCVDDAPVAVDDTGTVIEDAAATAVDVLTNDTDIDGGTKSIAGYTKPDGGTVVITGDGTGLTYEPDANFCTPTGTDDFIYHLSPGGDTATVAMTVTCVNDAPTVQNDLFSDAAGDRNAIGNTPLKVGVAAGSGPEKVVAGSLLANDSDVELGTLEVTEIQGGSTLTGTTTEGGAVTALTDGTFTYLPKAGFEGSDTFDYTVSDGDDTSTGTATVVVSDLVWYVDSSTAATGDDGTVANPFLDLDDLNGVTANLDAPGQTIFLYEGDSEGTVGNAYVDADLEAGQSLLSEAVGLTVDGVALVTAVPGAIAEITGSVTGANPDGAGITLADDTTVSGVATIGTSGPGFLAVGTSGVALTDPEVISSSDDGVRISSPTGPFTVTGTLTIGIASDQGLEVTGSDGAAPVQIPDLAITGLTTNGVLLGAPTTPNAGTVTITTGSIAPSTSVDVAIGAGSANVTIGVPLSTSTSSPLTLDGRTSGTVTLNEAVSSTNRGISIGSAQTNSGGVLNFTGMVTLNTGGIAAAQIQSSPGLTTNFLAGLDIDTTAGDGFTANNGGTITVVDAGNNSIDSFGGAALSLTDTTIGAAGMTFASITAANGSTPGIKLDTTGNGPLTVNGGSIVGRTTDGVLLTSASNVTLANMSIRISSDAGIRASSVEHLSLTGMTITDNTDTTNEAGLELTEVTGLVTIASSTIGTSTEDNASLVNTSGTTTLNVTDSTFQDTDASAPGNNGLLVEAKGSANVTATISSSQFLRNRANGLQVNTNDNGTMNVSVNGAASTFTGNNAGVNLAHNSSGTFAFDVRNALVTGTVTSGAGVNVNRGSVGASLMSGTIDSVTVDNQDSPFGAGIRVIGQGSGALIAAVTNNTITKTENYGIEIHARDGISSLDATVTGNNVTLTAPFALNALRVSSGATATDSTTVCANISGNVLSSTDIDLQVRQRFGPPFRLQGYTGAPTDTAAVATYLDGTNTATEVAADQAGQGFTNVTCATP